MPAAPAGSLVRSVRGGGDPRRLDPVLRGTARRALIFGPLFELGLALGGRG